MSPQLSPGQGQSQAQAGSSFESRVVVVCEKMMNRACWAKSKHLIHSKTFRGMTLLHLAAAQGYANLIQTLIKWRCVLYFHKRNISRSTDTRCSFIAYCSTALSMQTALTWS